MAIFTLTSRYINHFQRTFPIRAHVESAQEKRDVGAEFKELFAANFVNVRKKDSVKILMEKRTKLIKLENM